MESAERRLIDARDKLLTDAQAMIARLELHDALRNLNYLAKQDHPSLEAIRTAAQQLIPDVTAQREHYAHLATMHVERAEVLLKDHQFDQAIEELNQIPEPLRDRASQQMLERAVWTREEIDTLKQQIRQPAGNAMADLLASIDRLQELQPHDPQVQRWVHNIHDGLLSAANKKLKAHRYEEAAALLRSIPTSVQSDQSQTLRRHAEELEYFQAELQLAPTVNAASLEAAKRLVRIDDSNASARAALQEMTKRHHAARAASGAQNAEWNACPEQTHAGVPVHACPAPQRLCAATPKIAARLQQYPGQFVVACGLALQAIDRAAIPTSLMPTAKKSVLGLLRSSFRERPVDAGWGVDLSNTGLKAVQLTADDNGQVLVTRCIHITHRLSLTRPDAAAARKAILLESIKNFTSQASLEPAARVVTQWPGIQSLVRHLTIPPAEDKTLRDLLRREVQHQIPFPLQEVCWDTFRFSAGDTETAGQQSQTLLLAARRKDLEDRLELLREGGLEIHALQCDALAIHNFLHFELLTPSDKADAGVNSPASAGVAALDIGSDVMNVVVSFPDFVWFRAAQPAGDDLTTALTRRFKLTHDVAEQVKRDPTKVKRMSDLYEESCVTFRQMANQFAIAESDMNKVAPQKHVEQLLLMGGGAQTHGLLRFLRFGR